jgi:hypothetical protein
VALANRTGSFHCDCACLEAIRAVHPGSSAAVGPAPPCAEGPAGAAGAD